MIITKNTFLKQILSISSVSEIDYLSRDGHIMAQHVGKSEKELIKRVVGNKMSKCSSFFNEYDALDYIQIAIKDYADDLVDWLNDYSDDEDMEAEATFDVPIGYGYFKESWHDWNKGPVPCSSCKVIFEKDLDHEDRPYRIRTAYPEYTEEDKIKFLNK